MNKQIRNKALIVLAGLSFIGITAGVGIGIQRSALNSSYLAQFDNDKSESELKPPINDAELAGVVSHFALKDEWAKISASQAFKLHKDPLYAFRLSQAVDFSKIDKKFSHLFFDIQVNEATKVEGNAIKNLTVFVFDAKTKKEIATRAFNAELSGFSSVEKEDFIENFLADSSTYELDKDLLKTQFGTEVVFPSAFSIKFQNQFLEYLRKNSPDSFAPAKTVKVSMLTNFNNQFQQQEGESSSDNNNASNTNGKNGETSSGSKDQNEKNAEKSSKNQQDSKLVPKPENANSAPKKEEQANKKLVVSNEMLAKALVETVKAFGGLKLVAASGLQNLIPNNYILLPVASQKSLVKLDVNDETGIAKLSVRLLDNNSQEKLMQLQINGLSSIGEIKDSISKKVLKNQSAYLNLKPQVQDYLRKYPTKKISDLISSFSGAKLTEFKKQFEKGLGNETNNSASGLDTEKSFLEKLFKEKEESQKPAQAKPASPKPEISKTEAAKPEAAKPVAAKPEAAKPVAAKPEAAKPVAAKPEAAKPVAAKPETAKPVAAKPETTKPVATKPETTSSTSSQEKNQPKKEAPRLLDKQVNKDLVTLFDIYGKDYNSLPKDKSDKLIYPSDIAFWFDLKKETAEYQNYQFSFSLPETSTNSNSDKVTLNLEISTRQNLKLEIPKENRDYIDVPQHLEYIEYDKEGKKIDEQAQQKLLVSKAAQSSLETNAIFKADLRYSAYAFKKWVYPIEIDIKGVKAQQELTRLLVKNYHKTEISTKNSYLLFQSDLDKIFKKANLENYFSLSEQEKTQTKEYLKNALNPISQELEIEIPKQDKENETKSETNKSEPEKSKPEQSEQAKPEKSKPEQAKQANQTNSENSNSNSESSQSAPAAAQKSVQTASLENKVRNFQEDIQTTSSPAPNSSQALAKPAPSPKPVEVKKLGFGDYLVKYLDLFSTFKTEAGQKLAIISEYVPQERNYNFVFKVFDSENDELAAVKFQLHGVNETNIAIANTMPYAPQIFLDGRSGLEYKKTDKNQTYISSITSINNTKVSYIANTDGKDPDPDAKALKERLDQYFKDEKLQIQKNDVSQNQTSLPSNENLLTTEGLRLNSPLVYDYKRANPQEYVASRQNVATTTLTKGVLYLVFQPEKGLTKNKSNPYKLLSTTTAHSSSTYGLSNLELEYKGFNTLKLNWKVMGAKPVNNEFELVFPPKVNEKNLNESLTFSILQDGTKAKTDSDAQQQKLTIVQTNPEHSESLENYLGKTWILELEVHETSAIITIIPEQHNTEGKLKMWKSEIKLQKEQLDPDLGNIFGRGFDYGQIGDTGDTINQDSSSSSNPSERAGITLKAFAVFKDDRLLKDPKAKTKIRHSFIEQYFNDFKN